VESRDLLLTAFDNVETVVRSALDGIDPALLTARIDPEANTIGWLVWHLTRVQDHHVADAFGGDQIWTSEGWAERFGLDLPVEDTGYGHGPAEVAAVRASAQLLAGYHAAVAERTLSLVGGLVDDDLDRVVDERWDPPVTLGVRLVSVIDDDTKHLGQAELVRGLLPG
jgi:uncharacterized damage-inducible protein DinB